MKPGDEVHVRKAIHDFSNTWLLPGEELFLIEVRHDRARVRCPASGADCWVDFNDLSSRPPVQRVPIDRQAILHENRRAVITLHPHELRQLLQLPEGYEVEHLGAQYDPHVIQVVVSSPDLDPQPHDIYLPRLAGGSMARLHMIDEQGVRWTRWEWLPA